MVAMVEAVADAHRWEVDKDGCLLWGGAKSQGYGVVGIGPRDGHRTVRTHVVMWEMEFGPVPSGMVLDHVCHNEDLDCPGGECKHRACGNVDHLRVTTYLDNSRSGKRALPPEVRQAVVDMKANGYSNRQVARIFNINRATVSRVGRDIKRKTVGGKTVYVQEGGDHGQEGRPVQREPGHPGGRAGSHDPWGRGPVGSV